MPWIGGSPQASGKSPSAGPKGPTPSSAAAVDSMCLIFFFKILTCKLRRPRSLTRGRHPRHLHGGARTRLTTDRHRSSTERRLRRGDPPPANQTPADDISASKTPPASSKPTPTLCTSLDPWIPRPPAAGAAAGGGGIHGSTASEVGRRGGFRKSPLSTVDGREETAKSVFFED